IEAGSEGINVTNLSAKQELSRPAISHHLRILKENGIIVPHKVGTQIFYKVNLTQKFTVLKEVINSTLSVLSKIEESCEFDESLLEEKKDLQI
ncbi:MAG: ArsR family transcriptional regulator, partial [Spirochaetia bacterium]|nr:ArsR family transcriptional regulator [Spirochaetia bacterium]